MGVDLFISTGVGLIVPQDDEAWTTWTKKVDPRGNYGDEEYLEFLTVPEWVTFGTGGSYYDNKPNTHWFSVKRFTKRYYGDDAPGGVFGLGHGFGKVTITLDERLGLLNIAGQIGIIDPIITPFVSFLWH
jgi:hypothetical protein